MKYIFCSKDNSIFKPNESLIIYSGNITDFVLKNIPNVAYVCPFNHLGKLIVPPYFPDTQAKLSSILNSQRAINLDIGFSTVLSTSSYSDIFVIAPVLTSASSSPPVKSLFWTTIASRNCAEKYNVHNSGSIKTIIFPDFSSILPNLNNKTIAEQMCTALESDLNFDIFPSTPNIYFTRYGTYRR